MTPLCGVLLLDKPQGLSSFAAVRATQKALMPHFNTKKAGHTGTLDPMATGLLVVCFGEATKLAQFGLDADKGYTARLTLGAKTDTADADGNIIARASIPSFHQSDLDDIAKNLLGTQSQTAPLYSALKKDGKPLYEYARQGIDIDAPVRDICIHKLLLQKDGEHILINTTCSKGTYIRALGERIAESLGTLGHLTALRRTQAGGFCLDNAARLDNITAHHILGAHHLVAHLTRLDIDHTQLARLRQGQRLNAYSFHPQIISDTAKMVQLWADSAFCGVGLVEPSGRVSGQKLLLSAQND